RHDEFAAGEASRQVDRTGYLDAAGQHPDELNRRLKPLGREPRGNNVRSVVAGRRLGAEDSLVAEGGGSYRLTPGRIRDQAVDISNDAYVPVGCLGREALELCNRHSASLAPVFDEAAGVQLH